MTVHFGWEATARCRAARTGTHAVDMPWPAEGLVQPSGGYSGAVQPGHAALAAASGSWAIVLRADEDLVEQEPEPGQPCLHLLLGGGAEVDDVQQLDGTGLDGTGLVVVPLVDDQRDDSGQPPGPGVVALVLVPDPGGPLAAGSRRWRARRRSGGTPRRVVGRHCVLGGGNHQLVATERATHASPWPVAAPCYEAPNRSMTGANSSANGACTV